jgi:hypothetical protein
MSVQDDHWMAVAYTRHHLRTIRNRFFYHSYVDISSAEPLVDVFCTRTFVPRWVLCRPLDEVDEKTSHIAVEGRLGHGTGGIEPSTLKRYPPLSVDRVGA